MQEKHPTKKTSEISFKRMGYLKNAALHFQNESPPQVKGPSFADPIELVKNHVPTK